MTTANAPGTAISIQAIDNLYKQMTQASQANQANEELTAIRQRPDAWTIADKLIDTGASVGSRFFGIQLLQDSIQSRWSIFSEQERQSIRDFVVSHSINWAASNESDALLTKMDVALVDCIILDWPQRWPTILEDIINSARSNPQVCNNNIQIITILGQEVMVFNKERITSSRHSQLSAALNVAAPEIFKLLSDVLSTSSEVPLVIRALKALESTIRWLDPQYIFENVLLRDLCTTMLPNPQFKMSVLAIFGEVAALKTIPEKYCPDVPLIFHAIVESLSEVISVEMDFYNFVIENGDFSKTLIFTLSNFIMRYRENIEVDQVLRESLSKALGWLVKFMEVVDIDSFRVLCELWGKISQDTYVATCAAPSDFYTLLFAAVRRIMIRRMQRPQEILIITDENGKVTRTQADTLDLYKVMHDALVCLTNLDPNDTMSAINEQVEVLKAEFSVSVLNSVCWSVGAVSGAIPVDSETGFVLNILKSLLDMQSSKPDPEKQAILASGIMFVCSQYPRFLTKRRNVLVIVLQLLVQFMQSEIDAVKEMAVDTFKTIAKKCSKSFIITAKGTKSLLEEQLDNFDSMISFLPPELVVSVFDGFSSIIKGITDEGERSLVTTDHLMPRINSLWTSLISQFRPDDQDSANSVMYILRYNSIVCQNIGWSYHPQLCLIFSDMIQVYNVSLQHLQVLASQYGVHATNVDIFRTLRAICSAVCSILNQFTLSSTKNNHLLQTLVWPSAVQTIFQAYPISHIDTRVPEVLTLCSALTEKLSENVKGNWPFIFTSVVMPTIEMFKDNFEDYVPFRVEFIGMMSMIVKECYDAILTMGPKDDPTQMMVGSIDWCCRHPMCDLSTNSINLLSELFGEVSSKKTPDVFKVQFFEQYYVKSFCTAFEIMADTVHKFAFEAIHKFIRRLLSPGCRWDTPTNLGENLCRVLERPPEDTGFLQKFVVTLIDSNTDIQILRDFLIQLKQYALTDPELNVEENQIQIQKQNEERKAIPGMEGPAKPAEEDIESFLE